MFSLQTPPRRPHYSTPKAEFKTPSPPRGLPELPEPPSSSEDDTGRNDRTPMALRYNQPGDMTAMKTPRPPGAWLTTPAPRHVVKKSPERTSSAPQPSGDTSKSDSSGLPTPPSTWTRASSIPPQTPAPPGAWLGTPASTRPRSILKVRFEDIESETSEAVSDHPPVLAAKQQPVDVKREHRREAAPEALRSLPKLNLLSESPQEDSSLDRPSTPPSLRARLRQRSPGVRIVDAFGRVTIEKEEDVEHVEPPKREELEEQPKPFKPAPRETRATPRNRSIVKIVDAMGREIEEPDESTSEASFHLSHNEALARVRNTIADMAEDLSEADRSSDHLALDENRCAALDDASKAARRARNKISRSLQLVKNTESDLRSRYGSLRESMRKSKFLPTESVERQPTWSFLNRWVLGCFVIVQIILFLIMYRMSAIRAKHIFLTTYYDSFNPDLYLYVTRPDTINHSIPSSGWSIFSIPATIQRVGWTGVVAELWGNATGAFYHWQRRTWDVWGANAGGQTALSWPPT
ncbi:hypothetical protein A0H81_11792 [Grifola frondosa]|uniref:Uncharacterized protein n=1 Tax=Grifola frondosa TaxID=5627 RepID=A0A1C7LVC7_GRIFR|nr:hypothetical protein A0H81_11792 [Grifola frondosa]